MASDPLASTPRGLAAFERYTKLCHAMQTGVKFILDILKDDSACTPKHLRTGINTAMCDHTALVKTLCEAGVIKMEDYHVNLEIIMAAEVGSYTDDIRQRTGDPRIVLG